MHKYDWIKKNVEAEKTALVKDRAFWEHLSKEAYPLTKGAMRIPISLEPFVLDNKKYMALAADLASFMSAAQKIANAYYIDPQIAEVLAIDERECEIVASAKEKDCVGIVRLDLFYADSPQVVEINADYPDGFFMHDVTAEAIRELLPDSNIFANMSGKNHAELFSDLLLSEGANKDMHIFVGFDKERAFIDEFYLTKNKLEKMGWRHVSVGTFEDLDFKDGSFYFNKTKVDVLRRGSELSKIRKIPDFISKLIEAEQNGLIIINNFKMRLLGYKSLLAALWDERFHKYLNVSEIDAIKKLLPKTYKLDNAEISREILTREKNTWVIKPIDLAEGTDVFVGQALTDSEWSRAIDQAYTNPRKWIAQHRVTIPKATFNLIEENHSKINFYERRYDCNPHIILYKNKAELGTILVRFSESSVVNVAKGGGITYAFPRLS